VHADNSRFIREAAKARHDDALRRAHEAIRSLDESGEPMTFRSVAEVASVSRAWLYREPLIRAEIDRLRVARQSNRRLVPAAQRGSEGSQQRRIHNLLEENRQLKAQNRQLHDQVAGLLGEQRVSRVRPKP